MSETRPISGKQIALTFGDYRAHVASIGATLRALTYRGRDLIVPFNADELRPAYRGATLAPWPNRVVDGQYEFQGKRHTLALTEPERGHALHGLVAWAEFHVAHRTPASVTLEATIEPQAGYPHRVKITVTVSLDADGLHQTIVGTNLGDSAAPFGVGPHPYLMAGPGRVDDWTLSLDAASILAVDDRLSPTGLVPVNDSAHGDFDFREPTTIGDRFIDHAFTDLNFQSEATLVVLTAESGTGVAMSWNSSCPWVQIHTADQPGRPDHRRGLAVEPMTCPPDAFNSGVDLIVLEPLATTDASWRIGATEDLGYGQRT